MISFTTAVKIGVVFKVLFYSVFRWDTVRLILVHHSFVLSVVDTNSRRIETVSGSRRWTGQGLRKVTARELSRNLHKNLF